MKARSLFAPDPDEPLSFQLLSHDEARPADGVGQVRFELSSRGDRVPGRLLLPTTGRLPFPLLVVAHDKGHGKDAVEIGQRCRRWARRGAAVAAIDLPLHGERASAKLGERVLGLLDAHPPLRALDAELWIDFVRQSVSDLRRCVEGLAPREAIDGGRVGFAGFGLGAIVGAPFCAEEPRIRVAALAKGCGGIGPVAVDPIGHVGRFAPRPLLLVNARDDERIPRQRAEALHEAARDPKRVLWFDGAAGPLPEETVEEIWRFLAEPLALG